MANNKYLRETNKNKIIYYYNGLLANYKISNLYKLLFMDVYPIKSQKLLSNLSIIYALNNSLQNYQNECYFRKE